MSGTEVVTAAVLVALVWLLWRMTRSSLGSDRDSFMTKVVKVAILVMLVGGGIIWIVDRADDSPGSGSGDDTPHHPARHPGGKGR